MLTPDSNLGSYRLIQRIGAGGMGEVWKAEDLRLGRTVAIKILPAAVASDAEAIGRMRREARTAAQLYHPNIATIHSFEQDGDQLFIVMEFVEGHPLSAVIARGPMNEAEICRVGRGVAEALVEAHAKGIVHRDIKPDNVIVAGTRVKVLDFGIAKQMGVTPNAPSPDSPATFMTQQGMIIGTIQYMSPEQALGKTLDARTDIFSLGVVLYEAATGRLPFKGETVTDTMTQIIRDEPENPQLVNRKLSDGLANIIRRAMAKKREDRYATAEELSSALEAQLGRASTAPYTTAAEAPTAVRGSAAPTVVTGAKQVAVEPPKKKIGAGRIALIAALTAGIAAAVALNHRSQRPAPPLQPTAGKPVAPPPAAPRPAPPPPQPASTTVVSVTAPPTPVIVEQTTSSSARPAATATQPPPKAAHAPVRVAEAAPVPVPVQPPTPAPAPPVPAPVSRPASTQQADEFYRGAMALIAVGDSKEARKELHRALMIDPHYARAHFRMGEIAMMNRNFEPALVEYELALEDANRLNPHERAFTHLGVAISRHNREAVQRIAAQINNQWPDDRELQRIVPAFPGMFAAPQQQERQ